MKNMFEAAMMASAVEAAGIVFSEVHTLMDSYASRGIDVVPIREIDAIYKKAVR